MTADHELHIVTDAPRKGYYEFATLTAGEWKTQRVRAYDGDFLARKREQVAKELLEQNPLIAFRYGDRGGCYIEVNPQVLTVDRVREYQLKQGWWVNPNKPPFTVAERSIPLDNKIFQHAGGIKIEGRLSDGSPYGAAIYMVLPYPDLPNIKDFMLAN